MSDTGGMHSGKCFYVVDHEHGLLWAARNGESKPRMGFKLHWALSVSLGNVNRHTRAPGHSFRAFLRSFSRVQVPKGFCTARESAGALPNNRNHCNSGCTPPLQGSTALVGADHLETLDAKLPYCILVSREIATLTTSLPSVHRTLSV